jgi:hypothetical protein
VNELLRISLNDGQCLVWIKTDGETFRVEWTDGICEWQEDYPAFSYALAFLSVLQYCAETNWESGAIHSPAEFLGAVDVLTGKGK